MICPDCSFDNIPGADHCESCGQSLVDLDLHEQSPIEQSICTNCVEVLKPRAPVTVSASMTVREAVEEMVRRKIGCLVVEEEGRLVGIFTERDVLNKISDNFDATVGDFMTPSPETITSQDSIAYALHAMDIGGYRHMILVDAQGKATGIISVRDILHFLCDEFGEVETPVG